MDGPTGCLNSTPKGQQALSAQHHGRNIFAKIVNPNLIKLLDLMTNSQEIQGTVQCYTVHNQLIPDCGKFCRTNNFFFNKQEPSKQKQSEKIVND